MTGVPHHVRLAQLFDQIRDEFDACHAEGLIIPPMAATAVTNLGIALIVIRGQETGEHGDPRTAVSALLSGASHVTPTRLPH